MSSKQKAIVSNDPVTKSKVSKTLTSKTTKKDESINIGAAVASKPSAGTIASLLQKRKSSEVSKGSSEKAAKIVENTEEIPSAREEPFNEEPPNEEQSNEAENEEQEALRVVIWSKQAEFKDQAAFDEYLKAENCWAKRSSQKLNKGLKTVYRCNLVTYIGDQCDSKIYTLTCFDESGTIVLFWNGCDHTHGNLTNQTKVISDKVKKKIIELHNEGKTHMPISFVFRAMDELPPEDQPSLDVIKNTIAAYKNAKIGNSPITIEHIKQFAEEHLHVPENEDTAFVAGFACSPREQEEQQFGFFVTTKRSYGGKS